MATVREVSLSKKTLEDAITPNRLGEEKHCSNSEMAKTFVGVDSTAVIDCGLPYHQASHSFVEMGSKKDLTMSEGALGADYVSSEMQRVTELVKQWKETARNYFRKKNAVNTWLNLKLKSIESKLRLVIGDLAL